MGKFAIACPQCGHYVTAYNGLRGLIKKKITCGGCGNEFDVSTERMTTVKCPHCDNTVVYDQGKKSPKCPVCGNEITPSSGQKMVNIKCPECGVRLTVTEGSKEETCPICDCKIDVQREIEKDKYAREGLASIIKYEGNNSTFIWKHPIEDFNTGSQLIVHESQEAVFFRDGQALDVFGAGRYTLETQNLPLMNKLYELPTGDTKATFHTEVYFVNLATQMGIKWGTDTKVRVFDPVSGLHISIGASGEFNIRVIDSKRILLKLVGTTNGLIMESSLDASDGNGTEKKKYDSSLSKMTGYFRSLIMTKVKSYLAGVIRAEAISILEIDEHMEVLSEALCERINEGLVEYGLTMPEFYIVRFVTPEDDPSDPSHDAYMKMKGLYGARFIASQEKDKAEAERERILVEAQTVAQTKLIGAQAEAEAYRIKAAAEAEEMRMKGYTYQQETARQVSLEAMKNGLTGGGGSSGALGDIASLGISLGAMGSVIGMTKDTFQDVTSWGASLYPNPGQQVPGTGRQNAETDQQIPGTGQSNVGSDQTVQGTNQPDQGSSSQSAAEDPIAKLQQMKTMLDQNLITQEVYDAKVKEILGRI